MSNKYTKRFRKHDYSFVRNQKSIDKQARLMTETFYALYRRRARFDAVEDSVDVVKRLLKQHPFHLVWEVVMTGGQAQMADFGGRFRFCPRFESIIWLEYGNSFNNMADWIQANTEPQLTMNSALNDSPTTPQSLTANHQITAELKDSINKLTIALGEFYELIERGEKNVPPVSEQHIRG